MISLLSASPPEAMTGSFTAAALALAVAHPWLALSVAVGSSLLAALVVVWVLLQKSFLGFQIKVLGLDKRAAGFVGFREKRLVWFALLVSGALAGMAGVGLMRRQARRSTVSSRTA